MKKGLLLLALIFFAFNTKSQNIIKGTVVDANDGTPLPGANIYIPDLSKGVVTDDKGFYKLTELPKGEILITFSYVGYKTVIRNIKTYNKPITLNISLTPVVIQGEEVVISGNFAGNQHQNTVKISTLKSKNLLQKASPSFIEALTEVPGVDMISKGPGIGTPVIRGLSTSNILFLNNGIPLQNFQFSENHPYIIDESGVGSIEVLKGPASLLYGSGAVGGIINIIPQPPLQEGKVKGDITLKYFSNTSGLYGNIGLRGTNKNIIWGIHGNVNSNKDYYDGDNNVVPNSRFNTNSLKADVGFFKKVGTFRIFGEYSQNKLGLTVPPSIKQVKDNERKNNIWYQDLNNLIIHSQNKFITGKFNTNIDLSWQQNRRKLHTSPNMPVFTAVDMLLKTFYYSAKTIYSFNKRVKLSSGIQGSWQKNKNFDAPDHVLPDATTNEVSIFEVGRYKTDNLNLEAGIRFTYFDLNVPKQLKNSGDTVFIPNLHKKFNNISFSAGATRQLSKIFLIRINAASAFRTPNLAELTQDGVHGTRYEKGNQNLKTQRNTEIDAGIHLHTLHTTFDLSGFYNNINNYIYLSPSNDTTGSGLPIYYYRQSKAHLYGGEAKLHIHPHPTHWLHLMADWAYTIGKKNSGDYLPFIPAQKFSFEIKLEKERWHCFNNSYIKFGSIITLAQNKPSLYETSTPGYTLLNMSLGTTLNISGQSIFISFNGNNLTNKTYIDHLSTLKPLGIKNMGRNFSVVIKVPINFN